METAGKKKSVIAAMLGILLVAVLTACTAGSQAAGISPTAASQSNANAVVAASPVSNTEALSDQVQATTQAATLPASISKLNMLRITWLFKWRSSRVRPRSR